MLASSTLAPAIMDALTPIIVFRTEDRSYLTHHANTIRILYTLKPLGVMMAGASN